MNVFKTHYYLNKPRANQFTGEISSVISTGATDSYYAVYNEGGGPAANHEKTLISPPITPGSYCFSFWFYKTDSTSILTVHLKTPKADMLLWDATHIIASKVWTQQLVQVNSEDTFQIAFRTEKPAGFFNLNTVAVDSIVIAKYMRISTADSLSLSNTSTLGKAVFTAMLQTSTTTPTAVALSSVIGIQPTKTLAIAQTIPHIDEATWNILTPSATANLYLISTTAVKPQRTAIPLKMIQNTYTISTDIKLMTTILKPATVKATTTEKNSGPILAITPMITSAVQPLATKAIASMPTSAELSTTATVPTTTTDSSSYATSHLVSTSALGTATNKQSESLVTDSLLQYAIHVACESDRWNISVETAVMRRLYPTTEHGDIYLGETNCKGTVLESDILYFNQSLKSCSSIETKTNSSFNFKNKLIYAEHDPMYSFIIRRHVWDLNVECDVPRDTTVHTHVHHDGIHLPDSVITPPPNHSTVSLAFYMDSLFQNSLPGPPLHVKVGDTVYVKAYTTKKDPYLKLILHSCYVKPQASADGTLQYFLIRNGCVTDPNTHIMLYLQHEVRFVYQEIEYSSNSEGLEIFCQATLCDVTDYSARCSPTCNSEHLVG